MYYFLSLFLQVFPALLFKCPYLRASLHYTSWIYGLPVAPRFPLPDTLWSFTCLPTDWFHSLSFRELPNLAEVQINLMLINILVVLISITELPYLMSLSKIVPAQKSPGDGGHVRCCWDITESWGRSCDGYSTLSCSTSVCWKETFLSCWVSPVPGPSKDTNLMSCGSKSSGGTWTSL